MRRHLPAFNDLILRLLTMRCTVETDTCSNSAVCCMVRYFSVTPHASGKSLSPLKIQMTPMLG